MSNPKAKKVTFIVVGALLVMLFIIWVITSPKLIYYGSGEVQTSSIYYTWLDGNGHILDAHESFARIDEQTNRLHICHEAGLKENCQVYAISKREGLIGVLRALIAG